MTMLLVSHQQSSSYPVSYQLAELLIWGHMGNETPTLGPGASVLAKTY